MREWGRSTTELTSEIRAVGKPCARPAFVIPRTHPTWGDRVGSVVAVDSPLTAKHYDSVMAVFWTPYDRSCTHMHATLRSWLRWFSRTARASTRPRLHRCISAIRLH